MTRVKLVEGKMGEELAVGYLKKLGYLIIDRNFRLRNGEIDIVAIDLSTHSVTSGQAPSTSSGQAGSGQVKKKEKCLVFIEVKTRSSGEFGSPLESITWWKMKALVRAAQVYKISHRGLPELMRIDAISVLLSDMGDPEIEHIKNISG